MNMYYNGQYRNWLDSNVFNFIPTAQENTGTIEGEMLRAALTLCEEYHLGSISDNHSGALNYLMACDETSKVGIIRELLTLELYVNTGEYCTANLDTTISTLMDRVIEYVRSNPLTESPVDMLDFQDVDFIDNELVIF